jgi:hypothetical protein
MATKIEIINRALQKIGARPINSLTEDSKNARAVAIAYDSCVEAELRDHDWAFARKREQLAPDPSPPPFGYGYKYRVPSDFVRLVDPDFFDGDPNLDWIIENGFILTNDGPTLNIIYVRKIQNAAEFDPLFCDVLSTRIAMEICEDITQSNTKLENLDALYESTIAKAKKANSTEKRTMVPPVDPWILARR